MRERRHDEDEERGEVETYNQASFSLSTMVDAYPTLVVSLLMFCLTHTYLFT